MTDEILVTGFKLTSGEEVIFKGVQTGTFAEIYDLPATGLMGDVAVTFGHLVADPFVLIPPAPHMGSAWRLEPWPRMRRAGTCDQIFIKDRDVMFQLMTPEIDPEIIALYYKALDDQKWTEEHRS